MKFDRIDELFDAVEKGDGKMMKELGEEASRTLTDEQKKTVSRAMSDPEFLKSVLSAPKAQELMKKLRGGK